MRDDFIFTSESVTTGHPDKLCDQVSDAIVDHFLRGDPGSSIVAECALSSGVMFISAHYASKAKLDITRIARQLIRDVGYSDEIFDADACTIMTSFMNHTATDYRPLDLDEMDDADIDRVTARNPATVFGYACDHTQAGASACRSSRRFRDLEKDSLSAAGRQGPGGDRIRGRSPQPHSQYYPGGQSDHGGCGGSEPIAR